MINIIGFLLVHLEPIASHFFKISELKIWQNIFKEFAEIKKFVFLIKKVFLKKIFLTRKQLTEPTTELSETEPTLTEETEITFPFPSTTEPTTELSEAEEPECVYTDSVTTGTTTISGTPTPYLIYNTYDKTNHKPVKYTYVVTNAYSGIFRDGDGSYTVYGAGAVNFYNSYYEIDARVHDQPSCTCTCAYQSYSFDYAFALWLK